ncbi:DNA independent RNA polymerase I transcription factor [Dimargaris cristalligena]|nr:DNA independent RNA polymerase I transcription factor [Dimargaris cristalligena]
MFPNRTAPSKPPQPSANMKPRDLASDLKPRVRFQDDGRSTGPAHSNASLADELRVMEGGVGQAPDTTIPIHSSLGSRSDSEDDNDDGGNGKLDRLSMMTAYVSNALRDFKIGNTATYNEIIAEISYSNPTAKQPQSITQFMAPGRGEAGLTSQQFFAWMVAFTRTVSKLDAQCHLLVHTILQLPWTSQPQSIVAIYVQFLGNLVSAQPHHCPVVLDAVVQLLTLNPLLRPSRLSPSAAQATGSASPAMLQLEQSNRAHRALQHILSIVPTALTTLYPILVLYFPHKHHSCSNHRHYLQNLLRIIDYAPNLRHQVLSLVIDRIIQIDVEIQVEREEAGSESEEESSEDENENEPNLGGPEQRRPHGTPTSGVFTMDDLGEDSNAPDNPDDDDSDDDFNFVPSGMDQSEAMDKLDAMLRLLFRYFTRFHYRLDPAHPTTREDCHRLQLQKSLRQEFFHIVLDIFETIVLTTFKSRYTQFLMFHQCALDPTFPDIFLGTLISKLCDYPVDSGLATSASKKTQNSDVMRIAVAAYTSSFVARAQYVNPSMVRTTVGLLSQWALAYLEQYEKLNFILATQYAAANRRTSAGDSRGGVSHSSTPSYSGPNPRTSSGSPLRTALDYRRGSGTHAGAPPTPALSRSASTSSIPTTLPPNMAVSPEKHAVFYAVVQAIMYIFCFRWRDLVADSPAHHRAQPPAGSHDLSPVNPLSAPTSTAPIQGSSGLPRGPDAWCDELKELPRIVTCSLHPLHYCAASVSKQFTRMSKQLNFMYCYSHLQPGGGSSTPTTDAGPAPTVLKADNQPVLHTDLNTFFPYDPFNLYRSAEYIESIYKHWDNSSLGPRSEDEEDSSSEEEESETDESDDELAQPDTGAKTAALPHAHSATPQRRDPPPSISLTRPIGASPATAYIGERFTSMSISPNPAYHMGPPTLTGHAPVAIPNTASGSNGSELPNGTPMSFTYSNIL